MKILIVNCGSSSLKYQLIDMDTENILASGKYERIGEKNSFLVHKANNIKTKTEKTALNHSDAVKLVLQQLTEGDNKVINSIDEIDAVGHRIVHGGEILKESKVVNEEVKKLIKEAEELAPLHNPAALSGIEVLEKLLPNKPMVTVFDTAFHQTIKEEQYLYPLPYKFYEKYGIRKYGFHGTSHMYVANRLAKIENKKIEDLKIISCHLGQGSSLCAIDGGKSVDTSMGLTPLGGIPMVTRSGDIDPSAILYIMKKENISPEEMETLLNSKAGITSIADGIEPDFRELDKAAKKGNKKAAISVKIFVYSIAQYIAKYAVTLGKVDYIIFTGGIGENQQSIRKEICNKLEFMGVKINEERNEVQSKEALISEDSSKIKVFVIPTNEELMIAKETQRLTKNLK